MPLGLASGVIQPAAASPHLAWVQHLVNVGCDDLEQPSRPGRRGRSVDPGRHRRLAARRAARELVPAGGRRECRLGPRRLGLRRGVRIDLRPRPHLALRCARRCPLLRRRRGAHRPAGAATGRQPPSRPGDPRRGWASSSSAWPCSRPGRVAASGRASQTRTPPPARLSGWSSRMAQTPQPGFLGSWVSSFAALRRRPRLGRQPLRRDRARPRSELAFLSGRPRVVFRAAVAGCGALSRGLGASSRTSAFSEASAPTRTA